MICLLVIQNFLIFKLKLTVFIYNESSLNNHYTIVQLDR